VSVSHSVSAMMCVCVRARPLREVSTGDYACGISYPTTSVCTTPQSAHRSHVRSRPCLPLPWEGVESNSGSGREPAAPSARASLSAAPGAGEERCVSCAAPARSSDTSALRCADRSTDTAFRRPLASRIGCKSGTLARIRSCACSRAVSCTFCFLGDCESLLGPAVCSPAVRLPRRAGSSGSGGVIPSTISLPPGVVSSGFLRPFASSRRRQHAREAGAR